MARVDQRDLLMYVRETQSFPDLPSFRAGREILELVRPHLAQAYRHTGARERARPLVDTLDEGLEQAGGALAVIEGPRGRLLIRLVDGVSDAATAVLMLDGDPARPPTAEELGALGLTPREADVLRLVAAGRSNDAIASDLGISVSTVRKHLERIYAKLGVHTSAAAAARALGAAV